MCIFERTPGFLGSDDVGLVRVKTTLFCEIAYLHSQKTDNM